MTTRESKRASINPMHHVPNQQTDLQGYCTSQKKRSRRAEMFGMNIPQ
ncbi:hypothetical protein COLO4_00138 [Corchorus olitorius]|uniref:Uncharacterized protein n=1 Tax=Corchorus olitorius TaxID=93759 RepID=A0A1R3L1H5_9ROSI|nr:hypothetical protein COLO4_02196 [Corchorus olitorius]OMP14234.1 hypothetical protein COLO4_00148 [Corchorus olitorius]OMP14243.1 hypothetical protein COLO4_00138 [Corchorus olitorius]